QQHLIKIFKSVTGYALDRDENFFEVGISSLNILRVIQHLKKTYSVDYSNLVDYPTISSLSSYLDNLSEKKLVRKVNSDKDRTQISKINEREVLNVGRKGILLTGSTGFLGCHLLKELLKQKRPIHLLIRGKNVEDIYKRLAEKFYYYFSEDLAIYSSQLHFYCGDLEKVYCGLEESEFKKLCTQVSDVINSAASVKHFGKYEDFYKSNVISVKNLITFCKESQSALFHISTISLANICDLKANQSFSEEIILTNASTSNVYLQTKYEAEKTIFEAISEGLKANILRVGNIVGSSKTGIFQMNIEENAFYQILRSFFKLKMIPDSNEKSLEFTFVDECALAISEIINNKHLTGVYHIFNQNKISFNELFDFIKTQYPYLKKMTFSKIEETQGLKGTDAEEYFDIIKIHSSTANKNVAKIDNIFTNQLLDKYNFCWSRVDKKTILLLLEYCKEINFI
ncbi:mutanobactin A non-ribosomal peptide synthetase MubD, partial [Streptococcus mutans]|nr:mutanobactin A non-ribosomal peptide synthetase MubD [Streptococcus mutans]